MSLESPNFLERRPKWQVIGAIMLLVIGSYVLVFWLGTRQGKEWSDSEYLADREERTKQIAVLESKEKELAQENEVLRKKHEAQAEMLRQTDTAAEAKRAQEFQKNQDERAKKGEEIENATPAENVNGLCADAKAAGLKLSFCE